ncbi:MAG: hypothetical protein GY835_25835 [bacterium]|nr:hypothetical protein [bacterium]
MRRLIIGIMVLISIWAVVQFVVHMKREKTPISYSCFMEELEQGNMYEVSISDLEITGMFRTPVRVTIRGKSRETLNFSTVLPYRIPDFAATIEIHATEENPILVQERQPTRDWTHIFMYWLPVLLLTLLFLVLYLRRN